jgi:hypothetical protein
MEKTKKIFECKGACIERYVEELVIGCKKCIKKTIYPITDEQRVKIAEILNSKPYDNKR